MPGEDIFYIKFIFILIKSVIKGPMSDKHINMFSFEEFI